MFCWTGGMEAWKDPWHVAVQNVSALLDAFMGPKPSKLAGRMIGSKDDVPHGNDRTLLTRQAKQPDFTPMQLHAAGLGFIQWGHCVWTQCLPNC